MDLNSINSSHMNVENNLILDSRMATNSDFSEPFIGMEFDSLKDVEEFYTSFAKAKGFGIRIRSSKPNYCIFVCVREGKHKPKGCDNQEINENTEKIRKKCSTTRLGCQASLSVFKDKNRNIWVIKSFANNHNHIMVSPKSVSYMRCHRKMNTAAKNLVEKFNEEGLPTGKVATMFSGSDQAFSNRDCWNHMRNVRMKNLDTGDAQAVFNYCKQKQAQNSDFFYAIQCDDDARMINFFWVDARSKLAYQNFGDVITFDTTYRTNKYSMPFAPFTGLNHHLQSILFGCALLQNEAETTFIWLFETWLEAMNGKKPVSIITDQDLAIRAAVAKVFPETRHRLCLWHIRKKFPEKLSHIYHKNSTFKRDLKRCIRESSTSKDFEDDWHRIMTKYNLQENEWLQGLFKIRESWIPVYNRGTFFAGMNTTQRSESINSFFDSFVNSSTTIRDFVVKFEKAVDLRYEAEKREDYESIHKSRILSIGSKIEEHAASIYTRNVFGKFHKELACVSRFTKEKIEKNELYCRYRVSNCFDDRDAFMVTINLSSESATCSCQLFEFMGILCRHILMIFQAKNVIQIPSQYILKRWTKEANSYMKISDISAQSREPDVLRSTHVQCQFNKFSELARRSENAYKFIIEELDRVYNTAVAMEIESTGVNEAFLRSNQSNFMFNMMQEVPINIKDPHISQTKGRSKSSQKETQRFKSGLELSMEKSLPKKRACGSCGEHGHNRVTCKQKAV